MSVTYKIIYFGELQPGFEIDKTIEAFSKTLKISNKKVEKLLRTSNEVVLKEVPDAAEAEKYQIMLEKIGLVVRIDIEKKESSRSTLSLESTGTSDDESAQATENPYSTPEANLLEPEKGEMHAPTNVPAGHGWAWLAGGWWYFKQNPVAWIMACLTWILLSIGISMIPLIGSLAVNLANPVITAGFMTGCRAQDDGKDFTIGHLFAGFSNNTGQLILISAIFIGAVILLMVLGAAGVFGTMNMLGIDTVDPQSSEIATEMVESPASVIPLLVIGLLLAPLMMAYFFAPALVALDDMKALDAMKLSFRGCLKNLLPLTLYGLLAILLMILGSIPLGLGLLIVLPLLTASMYAAYRDIYYS